MLPTSLTARLVLLALGPVCAAALVGCGSDGGSGGSSSGVVGVRSGNDTCTATKTDLQAGKVTFDVKNVGDDVTEVYVYGKDGSGAFTKIVGEVENIAPQTSRDFPVTLSSGDYELACKPGQQGDGIRTRLTVTGTAAAPSSSATTEAKFDREVEFKAEDYKFVGLETFTAKVGEKIEFKLENEGPHQHEFEVFGPDGQKVGEIPPVDSGATGEAIFELTKAGTYSYKCGISNHADLGLKGTFVVTAS
ncbi:MAG: hypothetical protein QOG53_3684 [Frankiales bacterium]|nr:hypothetical protein [Frankiales bacterium]